MLRLEFLQDIHLLLLIARRLAYLFLPLVIHHFLHHAPRLAIEVTQLAVLRRDLRSVNFRGRSDDVCPPLHFVGFVEVDVELFAVFNRLKRPCRFVHADAMRKKTLSRPC